MSASPAASRPRVEGEREDEILDACAELLVELGYDRLTMDAVAKLARASKATLYRRWESKASMVVEALIRAKQSPHIDDHDTGTLRGDLLSTFCGHEGINESATKILGSVITALSTDPEFAEQFREKFIAPKVAITHAIYERAQERGEVGPDIDLEMVGPALAGILLHRTFILGVPPDDATIERVVDHVILPAVQHPSCGTQKFNHKLKSNLTSKIKARKTS
ncbi:TetR/AcrR family transcriptional regulator [Nocardioides marmoriginsengisoli]|uniref:TetR/AcrR family transcriptional regulator n=1 Tax=Nocardioides marmoriginsengisoli TaxID=661483 RepID=A0A3N0CPG0_9ACTN|nr:TetR/AcrR family transcriptional regulator [Nocardioides marmoriginsengisoli]RNL65219.1 TetR/AcrR family transcriptional regulator [Nocardioides marmoriginsengisoli]